MTTKIKNYTSTVSPDKTATRIEKALSDAGATSVHKQYENGQPTGIEFSIQTTFGLLKFRLPIKAEEAYVVLVGQRKFTNSTQRKAIREQAGRTAWKLAQDWVEVQLSLVKMKQAELTQVFLPYAVRGEQTLFEAMKSGGYAALLSLPAPQESNPSEWDVVEE